MQRLTAAWYKLVAAETWKDCFGAFKPVISVIVRQHWILAVGRGSRENSFCCAVCEMGEFNAAIAELLWALTRYFAYELLKLSLLLLLLEHTIVLL